MRCVLVLLALVAVAFAQGTTPIDEFTRITSSFQLTTPTGNQDRTTAAGTSTILGGEREVYIAGDAANSQQCTVDSSLPQSDVEAGFWSVAQGRVCAATFEMRLDGTQGAANNAATRDFGLGIDINTRGSGMRVTVSSDLNYSFTLELASSATAVSSVTQSVVGDPLSATEFEFEWADFSGSADLTSIGSISIKFPGLVNRDAEVSAWLFLTPNGAITGSVFEDCNCNGVQETGDDSLANVPVSLSGAATASTQTGANGQYNFNNLASGTYTVTVGGGANTCSGQTSQTVTVAGNTPTVNFNVEVGGASINCPADTAADCGATSTTITGDASVVSTCTGGSGGAVTFTDSVANIACTAPGAQISTITRTFSSAGAGSCTQTISVFDTEVTPVLTIPLDFATADGSVCDNGAPTSTTGVASASNTCTASEVSFTDSAAADCDAGSCTFAAEILRRWTARDQCGNEAGAQTQRITCSGGTECPPCPNISIPSVSVPSVSVPSVPIDNPPTRNCRFICDDDDSSASILSVSALAVVAVIAMLF